MRSTRSPLPAFLASILLAVPLFAGELSEVELRLVDSIERHQEEDLRLLEELVNLNSGTRNLEGVRRVGARLGEAFEALGARTEWLDGAAFGRAGHLVVHAGHSGPRILLIGHLDTVFSAEDPFQGYRKLDARRARGPGVIDMKGGDVIVLSVMRALGETGLLEGVQLRAVFTGDEEASGSPLELSKKALGEAAEWADYALGFEDGDGLFETAVVSRRGSLRWQLEVEGTPAHSSQIFTEAIGDGAIYEAARILDGFRRVLSRMPNLTFNPGVFVGGTRIGRSESSDDHTAFGKSNVVSRVARVEGDLRALSPAQEAIAKRLMRQIVVRSLPGTRSRIHFEEGYPPVAPTPANHRLLALFDQASQDLGFGPVRAVEPRDAGAADLSFAASKVEACLDGLGLMGTGGHTREETADLATFSRQAKRVALLIHRLVEGGGGR